MVQATVDVDNLQNFPEALQILGEMNNSVKQTNELVENMLQRLRGGEISTEYGLSFLEVKYHMLLDYLINLTYVVLQKCSGQTIEQDPSINRLIEIRTVLEKIRPIDYKLRYQIDKLVKTATTGTVNTSDPTSFKPKPENMISTNELGGSDSDSSATESDDNENKQKISKKSTKTMKSTGIYVPPKLTSVPYDAKEPEAENTKNLIAKAKRRAMTTSLIQDLKDEYLDAPTEISSGSRAQQILSKKQREKQEYEEAYLTRLPETKAEKHFQRKLTTLGTLGDEVLADIKDSSNVSKKRKHRSSKGKKHGGKKRRYH